MGEYPREAELYASRSPLHNADKLDKPVLILQGSEDRIVPPSQAEVLIDALDANDVPHAYVLFAGEGHGFVNGDSIQRALEAELSFYGKVLGFTPAGNIAQVEFC
ncbi:MAG: prolyl oligopeptidase family serine peptidase [Microthrixaceae bacterium]